MIGSSNANGRLEFTAKPLHFPATQQLSLSDGEEPASSELHLDGGYLPSNVSRKKASKLKKSRNESTRSLTDPNLKNLVAINGESNSDSTPDISGWMSKLPPSGMSRCRSPKPHRTAKSPSSEHALLSITDSQELSTKAARPSNFRQKMVSRFGSNSSSTSFLSVLSTAPQTLADVQSDQATDESSLNGTTRKGTANRSKLRLTSVPSCPVEQDGSKSNQSPSSTPTNPKSPFGKMKSFKDGFTSPDPCKYKHFFFPKYATMSSKKHLALIRKYSLPSEHFTLKYDCDDPGELIPSPPGQTLGQAINASVIKHGLTMDGVEVYLDSSQTPLPMSSDTFLLANNVLWVKVKESQFKRNKRNANAGTRKRQSSLTRFRKILTSMEDLRVTEMGDSQKVKVNQRSRLHSLLGSFSKPQQDKQEQLTELLETYSRQGLPKMPDLLTLGRPIYNKEEFKLEKHWTEVVGDHGMSKHERDQQEALWEMIVTEVEYIGKLQVITDLFVCCLINLQNDLILNEIEVDKLCSNIVDVYYANCYFWTAFLSQVVRKSRETGEPLDPSLLKPGFLLFDKIFEPYKKYCLEQEVCRDYTKNRLKDNELFRIFIRWAQSQPQCNRLELTDLIISPFQRLTRYKLLLYAVQRPINIYAKALMFESACLDGEVDGLHQSWPRCFQQKQDIDIMVEQVEKFVKQVNVAMRLSQDHQQLSQIVDKIEAYEIVEAPNEECAKLIQKFSRLDLTIPMHRCNQKDNRALITEGALKLKDANLKCDVRCYLFTDMFLVMKSSIKKTDKVRFKVIKPPMRLDKIVVHELKDGGSFVILYLNEFHIVQNVLQFSGNSRSWVEAINKAQKEYKEMRWTRSRKSDVSQTQEPGSSNYDDDFAYNRHHFDSLVSKNSDASRRSTSTSESLLKQEMLGDMSPSSFFSLQPSSLIQLRDGNDDDDSLFSSVIRFASKKSASQQTSRGLENRSISQPCPAVTSSILSPTEATFDNITSPCQEVFSRGMIDFVPVTICLERRSRSSDDIVVSSSELSQMSSFSSFSFSRNDDASKLLSKSMPNVANANVSSDNNQLEVQLTLGSRSASRSNCSNDDSEAVNDEGDDVSVFSGSFRVKCR